MVQTASLFSQLLHEVPRNEFARLVNSIRASATPKGSPAGRSSQPCCFVSWPMPTRSVRSATASPAAWGSWCILDQPRSEQVQPVLRQRASSSCGLRGPVLDDDGRFRAQSQLGSRTHTFRLRTNCCRSIPPPSVCASACFPGRSFAAPKAASKPTSCWTTTITCPPTC